MPKIKHHIKGIWTTYNEYVNELRVNPRQKAIAIQNSRVMNDEGKIRDDK